VDTLSYRTKSLRKEDVQRNWVIVDAEDLYLGRMATQIAHVLRGKHKPSFTPHIDGGDAVIVINAEKVRLSGQKMTKKIYLRHTGYPGGQREQTPADILAKYPERLIEMAVRGMLPKNRLGRSIIKKLFVYAGSEHPHQAQQPKKLEIKNR